MYEIHIFVKGEKTPAIPPYQLHIKNKNILRMKFISFSKVKKHPIYFSQFWYAIPPYLLHIKNKKILCMKFIL